MVEYEDIKLRVRAMSRLSNCTLSQAEFVAETLATEGVPIGGISLNPYASGPAETHLIPVETVNGLDETAKLAYQIKANGINMNASMAFRTLFPPNPWGLQMILDDIGWTGGK